MAPIHSPWSVAAILASATITFGTAITGLCYQHVSNAAPKFFYSLAVVSPLSGFICYSFIILVWNKFVPDNQNHRNNALPLSLSLSSATLVQKSWILAMNYCVGIGACFALHNILADYGKSGRNAGEPDVSIVLSLFLMKLVVPFSLLLESALDAYGRIQRPPTTSWQLSGVLVVMLGIILTVLSYNDSSSNSEDILHHTTTNRSSFYALKICCLCLSSIPLALGFYIVSLARRNLPDISGIELWALLCIPEFLFSVVLAFGGQFLKHRGSFSSIGKDLWNGVVCITAGVQPSSNVEDTTTEDVNCKEATSFFLSGIPIGLAYNLAIPTLVKLKGSTSVPLFQALALPIASLISMTSVVDKVIRTEFSWNAVFGVICCTTGLLLYYGADIQQIATMGYSTIGGPADHRKD